MGLVGGIWGLLREEYGPKAWEVRISNTAGGMDQGQQLTYSSQQDNQPDFGFETDKNQ